MQIHIGVELRQSAEWTVEIPEKVGAGQMKGEMLQAKCLSLNQKLRVVFKGARWA
jgi:hypothetical protein